MKKILNQLLFGALLVISLVYIWFSNELTIGATESELTFYNAVVHLNKYDHVWSPVGLGFAPGTPLASITFNIYKLFLTHFHFPDYMVQAVIYGILLITPFYAL